MKLALNFFIKSLPKIVCSWIRLNSFVAFYKCGVYACAALDCFALTEQTMSVPHITGLYRHALIELPLYQASVWKNTWKFYYNN